ncbi:hypothetical protein AGRA3207_006897 [Actinomadura graeca]|uniref:Uncharacterized protein n=1 Tax=Actinomadura graeca TaxID=2750812 RepID=A0ABX8R2W5_9ACTN|nr:hypothetical protein [Actinomadura graeca]QXJ25410.1 hypothetical protein AGRA3207_006897 [Actinomadura graeca]
MIILSGVLVVAAIALLVAGIVAGNGDSAQVFGLDALVVIYISIAVSIVSALCLAIGVFLRRKELFGPGAPPSAGRAKSPKRKRPAPPVPAKGATPAGDTVPAKGTPTVPSAARTKPEPADDEVEIPAPPADVPEDALVFVVRGRKRYHLDTCRQVAGRDTEELTYAEAKEEGFSPCTACMPDTALAARAAVSSTAPKTGAGKAEPPKPGGDRSAPSRAEGGQAGPSQPASDPLAPSGAPPAASAPSVPPLSLDKPAEAPGAEPEPGPAADRREDPLTAPLGPVPAAAEAQSPLAPERPAGSVSAAEEATGPTAEDPLNVHGTAAPRPRDAGGQGDRPAASPEAEPAAEASEDEGPQVRILSGTRRYHRIDCALIEDIGDEAEDLEALSRAEAMARGCTPCLVCQPDREHARD